MPSSRKGSVWPTRAATRYLAVAALLLVVAGHAQAQNFDNLRFGTTSGHYGAGASIDSSNTATGDFGSSVVLDNVAIGATQPPQGQNNSDSYGSFTELAANVTRTRTASAYTVVPEIGAATVTSQFYPEQTTNGMNTGATYTDQFWLNNPEASRLNQGLGFTWTPDPSTTATFPSTSTRNVNEMSLVITPPAKTNAQPLVFNTTFGAGSSELQFNVEFPFAFGFNPDALYTMTLHFFIGSEVTVSGKNENLPFPTMTANIQPPGTVRSLPFGTLQVTNDIRDAQIYDFETPPGPDIPEPASVALLGLGGIALLGLRLAKRATRRCRID